MEDNKQSVNNNKRCEKCGKFYVTKSNLNRHFQTCNPKTKFIKSSPALILKFPGTKSKRDFYNIPKLESSAIRYVIHQDKYLERLLYHIYIEKSNYHTVYLSSLSSKNIYIYSHSKWISKPSNDIMEIMVETLSKILLDFLLTNKQVLNKKCFQKVSNHLYQIDIKDERIINPLKLVLINNKQKITNPPLNN